MIGHKTERFNVIILREKNVWSFNTLICNTLELLTNSCQRVNVVALIVIDLVHSKHQLTQQLR